MARIAAQTQEYLNGLRAQAVDARQATEQRVRLAAVTNEQDDRTRLNEAYKVGKALGHKFTESDMNSDLLRAAVAYVIRYEEQRRDSAFVPFQFMDDMAVAYQQWGVLTPRQSAGVLNCMMNEARRIREARRQEAPAGQVQVPSVGQVYAPVAKVPDGVYTVVHEDGGHTTLRLTTLKPEQHRTFPGFPDYAQYLSLLVGPDNESSYARVGIVVGDMLVRQFRQVRSYAGQEASPEQLSRLDIAVHLLLQGNRSGEYGLAYALASNRCYRCNRRLTVPASICAGIGPRCREM